MNRMSSKFIAVLTVISASVALTSCGPVYVDDSNYPYGTGYGYAGASSAASSSSSSSSSYSNTNINNNNINNNYINNNPPVNFGSIGLSHPSSGNAVPPRTIVAPIAVLSGKKRANNPPGLIIKKKEEK